MSIRKVGRDAISGRFVSLRTTRRFPSTTTVETMEVPRRRRASAKRPRWRRPSHRRTRRTQQLQGGEGYPSSRRLKIAARGV